MNERLATFVCINQKFYCNSTVVSIGIRRTIYLARVCIAHKSRQLNSF